MKKRFLGWMATGLGLGAACAQPSVSIPSTGFTRQLLTNETAGGVVAALGITLTNGVDTNALAPYAPTNWVIAYVSTNGSSGAPTNAIVSWIGESNAPLATTNFVLNTVSAATNNSVTPGYLTPGPAAWVYAGLATNAVGTRTEWVEGTGTFTNTGTAAPMLTIATPNGSKSWAFTNQSLSLKGNVYGTNDLTLFAVVRSYTHLSKASLSVEGRPDFAGVPFYMQHNTGRLNGGGMADVNFFGSIPSQTEWTVETIRFTGGSATVRAQGVDVTPTAFTTANTLGMYGPLRLGGITGSAANDWIGEVAEVAIFTNAVPIAEVEAVERGLMTKYGISGRPQVLFVGDSITYGAGMTGGTISNLTHRLIQALGLSLFDHLSRAVSGMTVANMTNATVAARIWPAASPILVLQGGVNDLQEAKTAAQVIASVSNTASFYRVRGARVVWVTPTPSKAPYTVLNAPNYETERQAVLAYGKAYWTNFCDGFANVGGDAVMGLEASCDDTTLYASAAVDGSGKIHPTELGYSYFTPHIFAEVNRLLGGNQLPASAVTTTKYLRDDFTWATPAGGTDLLPLNNVWSGTSNHFSGAVGVAGTMGLGTVTAGALTATSVSGNGFGLTNVTATNLAQLTITNQVYSTNVIGGYSAISNNWTVGTRTLLHGSTGTIITNTATLTSSEWTAGSQKEWYNGAVTITIDKTNGLITATNFVGMTRPPVKGSFYTNYTVLPTSDAVLFASGTNQLISLPDATATAAGYMLTVISVGTGGSVVLTNYNGSQKINNSLSITNGGAGTATNRLTVICDGSNWW